jgi:serine/threonine protein kinase, bacterial
MASTCDNGNRPGVDTNMTSWSVQPQLDGTLRGADSMTVLTNERGRQEDVDKTRIVVTRTGDVPPAAVLADPAPLPS